MSNDDHTILNFEDHKKKAEQKKEQLDTDTPVTNKEIMEMGFKDFVSFLRKDDTVGFIGIVFNSSRSPAITHGGEYDHLEAIGTLEVLKNEYISSLNNAFVPHSVEEIVDNIFGTDSKDPSNDTDQD